MVYAALTFAGIPFLFLNDVTINLPEIDLLKDYQADFIIPSIKLIIEVQGAYWHSKPAAIEADAYKHALYQAMGYTVFAWWDTDIEWNLPGLMATSGILLTAPRVQAGTGGFRSTEMTPIKRTKIDTSQGIRTMNARKRKPYRNFAGTRRSKVRKGISSYATR
jgi:hypothetical protein